MAVLTFDQVVKKIKMDSCVAVDLWESFINKPIEENLFHKIHADTTEQLIDDLTLFASDFPGNYTIIARPGTNHSRSTGFQYKCKFDLNGSIQQPMNGNQGQNYQMYAKNGMPLGVNDPAKIFDAAHAKAMADMKIMFEMHTIKAERDFYKAQNDGLKTPAHKLGYLIEFGIERLFTRSTGINLNNNNPMNGSTPASGGFANLANLMNGNNTQQQQPTQLTPEQAKELEDNLGEIVKQIGIANINKLAANMRTNPSIGQAIKLQIESSK